MRRMTYDGISASGLSLVFRYTVQASDRDADGVEIGPHALTLEGGAIRDSEGCDSDLSLENADHSTWGLQGVTACSNRAAYPQGAAVEVPGLWTPGQRHAESGGRGAGRTARAFTDALRATIVAET